MLRSCVGWKIKYRPIIKSRETKKTQPHLEGEYCERIKKKTTGDEVEIGA
jgi:hypothetical protein